MLLSEGRRVVELGDGVFDGSEGKLVIDSDVELVGETVVESVREAVVELAGEIVVEVEFKSGESLADLTAIAGTKGITLNSSSFITSLTNLQGGTSGSYASKTLALVQFSLPGKGLFASLFKSVKKEHGIVVFSATPFLKTVMEHLSPVVDRGTGNAVSFTFTLGANEVAISQGIAITLFVPFSESKVSVQFERSFKGAAFCVCVFCVGFLWLL